MVVITFMGDTAVFAGLVADIMNGLLWNGIAVYLDNIIIGGKNFQLWNDYMELV